MFFPPQWGAFCFGFVIGWITYRTLRRNTNSVQLSDIATVIGAVGGAAVTALFKTDGLFAGYCFGLAIGFFAYLIAAIIVAKNKRANEFMGDS